VKFFTSSRKRREKKEFGIEGKKKPKDFFGASKKT
jgi:hypothetical protein